MGIDLYHHFLFYHIIFYLCLVVVLKDKIIILMYNDLADININLSLYIACPSV